MDVILPLPESATGGIHPLTVPDPPKSPPTDHLPPTNGARAITDAFTRAMDLDVVDEESAIELSEPRVQDEILVESAASSMRIWTLALMRANSLCMACQQCHRMKAAQLQLCCGAPS